MHRLGSSYRARDVDETLQLARRLGPTLGVSRVTDTTRLDRIGIPVFAAIRPDAIPGSLCVSAGKGLTPKEAEAGAWMESIELALAEPHRAALATRLVPSHSVLDGNIDDLCPAHTVSISPDDPILVTDAEDVVTGETVALPAELAAFPFDPTRLGGKACFGSDGNGICSGNSVDEATLHGLHEVIERDVSSFNNAGRPSLRVRFESLPEPVRALASRLGESRFELIVRYLPNDFDMPVYLAAICEPDVIEGVHFGYGCHLDREIALVRAVTEAMQSRLTCIHGGRDDLGNIFLERSRLATDARAAFYERALRKVRRADAGEIDHGAIAHHAFADLATALRYLTELLARHGFTRVLRVRFTRDGDPLQALRVVVPKLEMYAHGVVRIGPRIRAARADVAKADAAELTR